MVRLWPEPRLLLLSSSFLECSFNLNYLEGFDDVALLDVIVAGDAHTGLLAGGDLLCLVLADLERAELSGVDHDAVADEAHLRLLDHLAVADDTAGDGADLADAEGLLDLGGGDDLFLLLRLEHTLDTVLDFVDTVVNHGVEADFDAVAVRCPAGLGGRTHLEADDHGVRSLGKQHV